mmetsp:Transcript_11066/g.16740  ORF Transcript_11066/g.16740 Transcript_11066/m.16740 type:complete len:234 (-) Transcript_11066:13-714(-)
MRVSDLSTFVEFALRLLVIGAEVVEVIVLFNVDPLDFSFVNIGSPVNSRDTLLIMESTIGVENSFFFALGTVVVALPSSFSSSFLPLLPFTLLLLMLLPLIEASLSATSYKSRYILSSSHSGSGNNDSKAHKLVDVPLDSSCSYCFCLFFLILSRSISEFVLGLFLWYFLRLRFLCLVFFELLVAAVIVVGLAVALVAMDIVEVEVDFRFIVAFDDDDDDDDDDDFDKDEEDF